MSRAVVISRRTPVICCALIGFISLLVAVGIAKNSGRMAPIHDGDSHEFWRYATGVSLTPAMDDLWGGDAYFIDDDWAAYDEHHLHGSTIYRVPAKEVSADFEKVVAELERKTKERTDSSFIQGYLAWRDDERTPKTAPSLLDKIKAAMRKRYLKEDPDLVWYTIAEEQHFWLRWRRAKVYWTNHAFDWGYLTWLSAFILWPGIRGKSIYRWAAHVSLAPLLLMLPCYLGYAMTTFTSCGPDGGVIYPRIIFRFRRGIFTAPDGWILEHTPRLLEPLTTPLGTPAATTGLGMPGPISAVVAGLVLGAAIIGMHLIYRVWREQCNIRKRAALATKPESSR